MKERDAVCLNRCLNSSLSFTARIRTGSSMLLVSTLSTPSSSMRLGEVIMNVSSVTDTDTLQPFCCVSTNAYARDSESLTRRPKGKWNTML